MSLFYLNLSLCYLILLTTTFVTHCTEVPMRGIMEVKSSEEFNQLWNGPTHLALYLNFIFVYI